MVSIAHPAFTVLSDHAGGYLGTIANDDDSFALGKRLTPMFDIVRHKETSAPLAMAIFGRAGTGKTSALRWIQYQLGQWNQIPVSEREEHPRALPIWFSLCNFTDPNRASGHLVARMVFQALELLPPTADRADFILRATELCRALPEGAGLVEISRLASEWGIESASEASSDSGEFSGDVYLETYADFVDECLAFCCEAGDPARLVVLLDDLDHSSLKVMVAVLNLMAARYRSDNTVFIAALDPLIAQKLILRHFRLHEFSEEQGRHYLSKVFQVECHIEPDEEQMRHYFCRQRDLLDQRTGSAFCSTIPDDYKNYIEGGILHLAARSPRKIKLLLNSALLKAMGVKAEPCGNRGVRYAQSIQMYLLQRWLSYFTVGASAMLRTDVQRWFTLLSNEAVKTDVSYSDLVHHRLGKRNDIPVNRRLWDRGQDLQGDSLDPFEPPEGLSYSMIHEWVWDLLKIPYDPQRASFEDEIPPMEEEKQQAPKEEKDLLLKKTSPVLRDLFAAVLEKSVAELTDEDLRSIRSLELSEQQYQTADYELVGHMDWLERLDLHNSGVRELSWVSALDNLKSLNLTCTGINDLSPLSSLKNLEVLDLSYTSVTNLLPLSGLTMLRTLVLYGTPVSQLEPLRGLPHLERLNLSYTKVEDEDIGVITSLPSLSNLFLRGTAISPIRASELNQQMTLDMKLDI